MMTTLKISDVYMTSILFLWTRSSGIECTCGAHDAVGCKSEYRSDRGKQNSELAVFKKLNFGGRKVKSLAGQKTVRFRAEYRSGWGKAK